MALVACSLTSAWAQFSGAGSGTESDPYKIYNAGQLHQVRNFLGQEGVVFQLMNDIDLADWIVDNNGSQGWEPIGVESQPFKGIFNGNGKKLTGFSITRSTTDYVGFFGYISGATIKNLTIEGSVTGRNYVGGFVGKSDLTISSTLTGLTHIGSTTGVGSVGGIAGSCAGNFNNLRVTGDVTGSGNDVGGAIGRCGDVGSVSGITVTGNVINSSSSSIVGTGGIVGYTDIPLSNVTYSGDVTGGNWVGGIVGYANANINGAKASGSVNGKDEGVGGICGKLEAVELTLGNCSSECNVTGTGNYVGGVLGYGIAAISHCSSFGNVQGVSYVGGIIGGYYITPIPESMRSVVLKEVYYHDKRNYKETSRDVFYTPKTINESIINCYAVGSVFASGDYAGGILGYFPNGCSLVQTVNRTLTLSSTDQVNGVCTKGKYIYNITGTFTTYNYRSTNIIVAMSDNYFSGDLHGRNYVGGIVGLGGDMVIKQNYSNADIIGSSNVGGIIGHIQDQSLSFEYYPYDSSSSIKVISTSSGSELKSNMAINSSVVATSNAGRIYGSKDASGVTIAVNGSTDDNRALETGRLIISGVTQQVEDSEQNGVNNGPAYFKLRQNYNSHGWDLNANWSIIDTETYPYKPWQAAPPTINQNSLVSGSTSINGGSTDGGTIYIEVGNNAVMSTTCSGTTWSLSGVPTLQSGATVSAYTKTSGKENSYRTLATVGFLGSGTQADPWRVYTAYDLQGVFKSGYYKQMNDIDLTSWINTNSKTAGWIPVGYSGSGAIVYDGDNHKVTGLWINTSDDYVGLFSSISNCTIRNLTVEASSKQVKGGNYTGLVIGRIGEGILENVSAKGNVSARDYVGGVAGYASNTNLQQVSYTGQVTALNNVGGITSYVQGSGTVTGCEAKNVTVRSTGELYVGGLVGYSDASITNSKVTGAISLEYDSYSSCVGGLAGYCTSDVTKCSADVSVSSASVDGKTAGLVADGLGSIRECSSAGSVTSTGTGAYTGGLIASLSIGCVIENCYSTANVTGTKWTAGLVAYNEGVVQYCYSAGNVSSVYYGAGLLCENCGSLAATAYCVALGSQVGVSDQTGWSIRMVGNFKDGAPEPNKSNLFAWQGMQVSVNGIPKTVYDDNVEGTSITTAQTKSRDTYESLNWDFDNVWSWSSDCYPVLQWEEQAAAPVVTKGDLNSDGSVSISDVVLIIDVIAGTITDANQVAAADVNGDGDVSITDCVAAIDLIAAQSGAGSRMAMPKNVTAMTTDNNDYLSASLCDGELSVALNNDHRYTAFQMLVTIPEGMTLGRGMIDEMRGAGHQLAVRSLGNGQYLLAGFSMDNEELSGSQGRLFTVATSGESTGCITISNVRFADVRAEEFSLRDLTVTDTTTGISETGISVMGESNCFDLQGRRVERPTKGLYIMNGKKMYHK